MRSLTCEMCNGTDLVKQDGFFVCQNCGTKYSVEEAKRMMVEGTVKIDNSEKLNNLYVLARQARESNDSENAIKYYEMIRQEDPKNWEAFFFFVYYRATENTRDYSKTALSLTSCIKTVFNMIKNTSDSEDDKKTHVSEVAKHVLNIGTILGRAARHSFDVAGTKHPLLNENLIASAARIGEDVLKVADLFLSCADLIERDYSEDIEFVRKNACELWKSGIEIWKYTYSIYDDHASRYNRMKNTYVPKIAKYDSNYEFAAPSYTSYHSYYPNISSQVVARMFKHSNSDFGKGGGCYVATAVYGTYDCPEVWTLRRYRDFHLAETWHGRIFIRTYYAISPALVKWFGHTKWFKKMWRRRLDHMVCNLQRKGFDALPYQDREW